MEFRTVEAIFILIVKAPFMLVGYLFKHRGLLIIGAIVVVAIIVLPRLHLGGSSPSTQQSVATYQQVHPEGTPIKTVSRLYYAVNYTDDGKILTMTKFYDYDGKKWVLETMPLQLDRTIMGQILIDKK